MSAAPRAAAVLVRRLAVAWALLVATLGVARAGDESVSDVQIGTPDGLRMRRFLHDLVAATGRDAAKRPDALRRVFKRHHRVHRWVLDGRDLDRLVAEAGLESFRPAVMGADPTERYIDRRIARMAGSGGLATLVESALGKHSAVELARRLPHDRLPRGQVKELYLRGVDAVPDAQWNALARDVDSAIEDFKLTRTGAIAMLDDPANRIEIPDLPPKQAARMQGLIRDYFDHIALEDKRGMLLATLELAPTASLPEQLGAVLHSAGPVAQKLFQLLGRNAKSPLVRDVMNELKSQVRPFDDRVARRVVEKDLGIRIDDVFSDFERVGSATAGQVYRATIRSTGRVAAIKVLRPGIRERAARELSTLRRLASTTFERDMVETIGRKIDEELDLVIEGRNVDRGQVYNRRHSGIAVPERLAEFPVTRDVLVVSFAEGSGLDRPAQGGTGRARGRYLVRRGRALTRMLQTVMEEGLSSGLVHADLHGGNMLESPTRRGELLIAPLDWGSVVELSLPQRRGFADLGMGVIARSPRQVVAAVDQIAPMTAEQKAALRRDVGPLLRRQNGIHARVIEVLSKAIEHEVRIPEGVTGFARTQTFLLGQIDDVNEELDRVDPRRRLARFRPVSAAGWAGYRVGARDLLVGATNHASPARLVPGVDRPRTVRAGSLVRSLGRMAIDAPSVGTHLGKDLAGAATRPARSALRRRVPRLRGGGR